MTKSNHLRSPPPRPTEEVRRHLEDSGAGVLMVDAALEGVADKALQGIKRELDQLMLFHKL